MISRRSPLSTTPAPAPVVSRVGETVNGRRRDPLRGDRECAIAGAYAADHDEGKAASGHDAVSTLTCLSCGKGNPAEASFCMGCGSSLAESAPREVRKVVTALFCDLAGST